MLRVLIDTNVALDFCLGRKEWGAAAERILSAAVTERIQVVFPATSLKDVFYLASKHLTAEKAGELVDYFMDVCLIGDVTADTCKLARLEQEPDFEDGIVAAVAREQMADIIVSRDQAAFQHACAPKVSPLQFVQFFLDANADALFYELEGETVRQL